MLVKKTVNKIVFNIFEKKIDYPISYYVRKMRNDETFTFSRFGDGEWSAIMGKEGENCDGHYYYPAMGELLKKAIIDCSDYYYAIQPASIRWMGAKIANFLKKYRIKIVWHNSDVFHRASINGKLYPLIEELRKKHVVVIGPPKLRCLNDILFDYEYFVEIPSKNCFSEKDNLIKELKSISQEKKNHVFCFSASMATNVIINELYPQIGEYNWMLDLGSLWDPYTGDLSRNIFRKYNWENLIKANTEAG